VSIEQDEPIQEPSGTSSGTVLVVDGEESMLVMTRIMMEKMGFTVLTAMDGLESVEVFGNHYKDIVLVLLDITMPRLNGDDPSGNYEKYEMISRFFCSAGKANRFYPGNCLKQVAPISFKSPTTMLN